ncbi:MAG: ABC transporter ATP-binding protein/permease [Oscillospiraceae bacterium]|nr:ABC transporter ATP-binding protein/permease [Oscillospiraceae bacterium]
MVKVFKKLTSREWGLIALSIVFIVIQVWLDLKLPDYMSSISALLQTDNIVLNQILVSGGYMIACALGSLVCTIVVGYFAATVAASLSRTLRKDLYDKTLSLSMAEINRFSTASLITRTTNDIRQIQLIVAMGLQAIIKAPILAVWAIVKIMGKSWQWSAATGVAVLILIALISIIIFFAVPRFKIVQKLTDNLNRITREQLTGIRVVRAYNAEEYQGKKFDEANTELTRTNTTVTRVMAILGSGMTFIMSFLTLAIYIIGAILIQNATGGEGAVIFGNMVVFTNYAMQVIMAFMMLSMIFIMLPRAAVSAGRINEVLDTDLSIQPGTVTEGEPGRQGEVVLQDVSFRYPGAEDYVLKDVNVTIGKGETVAFIGATGSGKSTLVNLIPRFYEATEGEILVDGVNVKDYVPEALNNKLGYVSQRAVMFSGTVESNVAYGDNGAQPDPAQVEKAIRVAQAQEFVNKMEGQLEGHIAQGGTNLSGGQKQRLSIARAVCRDPEIYIFDDTFSALDYKTDKVLRAALKEETDGATVIMVAQRIGTIRDADKIIVLDQGRVVGQGTHEALLASCDVYREIALSQLSEEELLHGK